MDTLSAFAMRQANRGSEEMVFDWDQALRLIRNRGADEASAGLSGDWEYTGGPIWSQGKPVPMAQADTYLSSTWATPELEIDGERFPCFKMAGETDGWDAGTYWPNIECDHSVEDS